MEPYEYPKFAILQFLAVIIGGNAAVLACFWAMHQMFGG